MTDLKKEFLENALEDKIQNNLDLDKEENIQDEKDKKPQKKKSGFFKRKTKRIGVFFGNNLYPKEGRVFFPTIKKNYSEFLEIFTNKPRTFNDYEEWANYMGIKEDDTEDILLFTINSKTFITLLITLVIFYTMNIFWDGGVLQYMVVIMNIALILLSVSYNLWMRHLIKKKVYISFKNWILRKDNSNNDNKGGQ